MNPDNMTEVVFPKTLAFERIIPFKEGSGARSDS